MLGSVSSPVSDTIFNDEIAAAVVTAVFAVNRKEVGATSVQIFKRIDQRGIFSFLKVDKLALSVFHPEETACKFPWCYLDVTDVGLSVFVHYLHTNRYFVTIEVFASVDVFETLRNGYE